MEKGLWALREYIALIIFFGPALSLMLTLPDTDPRITYEMHLRDFFTRALSDCPGRRADRRLSLGLPMVGSSSVLVYSCYPSRGCSIIERKYYCQGLD